MTDDDNDPAIETWKLKNLMNWMNRLSKIQNDISTIKQQEKITLAFFNNWTSKILKVKRLIKGLEIAKGNGTSMISLILPPKTQIPQVQTMLQNEFGTASNIKNRVNRQSVLAAITSAQHRLKLYNKVPENGLVIYTGTVLTNDGKERKINIDFEPFKPINTSLYLCDNKFHTEALSELLESDVRYGFIVIDGNGALFGALSGNSRDVLQRLPVELPKKHGRGGQSALRFARLRLEKRHNYIRKVAEFAVQNFISNGRPNIAGLILAGSADFKIELSKSEMFDIRLQENCNILKTWWIIWFEILKNTLYAQRY